MREETPISAKKIWMNVKRFWWICALTVIMAAAMVVLATWREYKANVAAAMRDTYQANSMIFFPVDHEMEAQTLMTVLDSQRIVSKVDAELTSNGMKPYDSGFDKLKIEWKGNCFPISVITEGEERARIISKTITVELLDWAEANFSRDGEIVNETNLLTCIVLASGETRIYSLGTPRSVNLSIGSFLGWKKIMVMCAGFLCGCALIFVLLIFDTKLRSQKEIEAICGYPCLGGVRKNTIDDRKAVAAVIYHKREIHPGRCLYVSCKNNAAMTGMEDVQAMENVDLCKWSTDRVAVLAAEKQYETAVLFVSINKDTVDDVKIAIADLENVQTKLLGYVVTEG